MFEDRIIAGRWKGRKLILPDNDAVRPSKNRLRQAVFNMLGSRIEWHGMDVIDVCCGSGAWGIEAASRGAASVLMMDMDVKIAEQNVKALRDAGALSVVKGDVRKWSPPAPVSVVLADPPYAKGLVPEILRRAAEFGNAGSWWAVEHGSEETFDWAGFDAVVTRTFGVSAVTVARRV